MPRSPTPVPATPVAFQTRDRLAGMLAKARDARETAERTAGQDFAAVAQAGSLDATQISRLAVLREEEAQLTRMLAEAERQVERAQSRDLTRAVLDVRADVQSLMTARFELAARVEAASAEIADAVDEILANGQAIVAEYRKLGRPGGTLTTRGHIVSGVPELLSRDHMQHMLTLELSRRLPWWRYERQPPWGRPSFGDVLRAASTSLALELDPLLGITELDPEMVDVVNAEDVAADAMQAARAPRALLKD